MGGAKIILASPKRGPERQGDLKQERHRQDRQTTGEGKSKHYKQVSHGATLIFDDVFLLFVKTFSGPNCPSNFNLHPAESDGRTCYSVTVGSAGPSDGLETRCRAWPSGPDSFLRRPGLPAKRDIVDILRPDAK